MVETRARPGEAKGREERRTPVRRTPASAGNRTIDLAGAAIIRTRDALLARAFGTWAYGQTLRGPMPFVSCAVVKWRSQEKPCSSSAHLSLGGSAAR